MFPLATKVFLITLLVAVMSITIWLLTLRYVDDCYRIGDSFYGYRRPFLRIRLLPKYRRTLMRGYHAIRNNYQNFDNHLLLFEAMKKYESYEILVAEVRGSIVVHVRLGDMTPVCKDRPMNMGHSFVNGTKTTPDAHELSEIIKGIVASDSLNRVLFVTGNHKNVCVSESAEYVTTLQQLLPMCKIINSGNSTVDADSDLIRMVTCDVFVPCNGNFSRLALEIRQKLGRKVEYSLRNVSQKSSARLAGRPLPT